MYLSNALAICCRRAAIVATWTLLLFGQIEALEAQTAYFQNGCKVGPNYRRPVAPVAPGWIDEGNPHVNTWASREQLWWVSFNDPTLNALIQSAYAQSLTLRSAGMRVLQARAQRDIAHGDLFPQLQEGFGAYNRIAESLEVANRSATNQRFFDDWIFGGRLAWELDFWGQFRRNFAAADARLDAQLEDYDDVLVILVADVASAYIDYRTFEQRLVYARQNQKIQSESVRLARIKVDAGTRESDLDLPQAQADLANVEALIPDLELGRRQSMNRLSVLLGMPPADLANMLGTRVIPVPPANLALGIPADLLRQRPDVRRAERDLAAQCEEIGIAVADLYPHISINGTIFVNSEKFSNLFTPRSWGGAVGPSFRWDILNYGRLMANVRLQEARFNELIYDYQHKVLTANEEVENAVASFLYSHQKTNAFQTGATVSIDAVGIGTKRYQDGVSDFNRLSNLQVELAQQQDSLAFSQGQIAQSWVDVYRSLGGGWQVRLVDAQPYRPGISDLPQPENGSDLPPNSVLPTPSKPDSTPAPSKPDSTPAPSKPDSTSAPSKPDSTPTPSNADSTPGDSTKSLLKFPQSVTKSEPAIGDQPKSTIMSRLAKAKTFILHPKTMLPKADVQKLAEGPNLEQPQLVAPEHIEPKSNWIDLVEVPPSAPKKMLSTRQQIGASSRNESALATATMSRPTLAVSKYRPTEMTEALPLHPTSSNLPATATISQPSFVQSNDEPIAPSEVGIGFSNRGEPAIPSMHTPIAQAPAGFNRVPSAQCPCGKRPISETSRPTPQTAQELAIQMVPIPYTDSQLTEMASTADDVPNNRSIPDVRSSRNPRVLNRTYVR
jgi:NodT family efflux transporter outer membrane factor (OMF) lipoprotein